MLLQEPKQRLANGSLLDELPEDEVDRVADPLVRIHHHFTIVGDDVPRGQLHQEFPAARLLKPRIPGTKAQNIQFVLVERALHSEEESVVPPPGIIDRLVVHEQRSDELAHLDELLPFTTVSREARHLPRSNSPNFSEADLRNHAFEARALRRPCRRTPEVLIDDLDDVPPELT